MLGLTMDYPLTVTAIARRAEALFGNRPIVSRRPDRTLHRTTYAECLRRARRLAGALHGLGIRPGDRVATLCWNHDRHLETYFAVPLMGAVLHTLNLRLHPDELAYVARHAEDRVLVVDASLLPLLEKFRDRAAIRHVVVVTDGAAAPPGMLEYEALLAGAPEPLPAFPEPAERDAAVMCYTSGTTGRSKGVVYSHRALVLHSMATAMADSFAIQASDVVLAVVPMFHANAWGLPFTAAFTGAGLVFPGPHLEPAALLELCAAERVTFSGGVPTVWLGVLEAARRLPGQVRSLRAPHDRDRRRGSARVAGTRPRGAPWPQADHLVGHDGDGAGRDPWPPHAGRRGAAGGRAARAPDEAGGTGRAARAPRAERAGRRAAGRRVDG